MPPPRSPPRGTPVFAYKGESLDEYWDYTHRIFEWADGGYANMILDDGGDATLLLHLGARAEKDASRARQARPARRSACLFAAIKTQARRRTRAGTRRASPQIKGVTEETTTGVHRLYQMAQGGQAAVPRDQRQRLGHQEQVRQPVRLPRVAGRRHQARHRRDDRRQGRRRRGYGDVGKGSAQALRALSAQVWVTEIDPICALQAAMEGYRVVTMDYAADKADIFVTATGNFHVITHEHMAAMKNKAIVCNIGHFDNEIDVASLEAVQVGEHQAAGRPRHLPGRQADHPAGRGPPGEPRLRHRPSVLRDELVVRQPDASRRSSCSRTTRKYPVGVYVLPKHLDEKVARLQLKKLNVELTELTRRAGALHRRRQGGPYKSDHYRY